MSLSLTLIQSDLHWEDKESNLRMFEDKINSIQDKTQVIILPEMFNTGFSMNAEKLAETMDGITVTWMKQTASKRKVIITGSVIIEEAGHYFNRLIWMLPNGQHGHYDKRHLFAYANEDQHYTSGENRFIASVNGWKVNLQVCYDLRFPVWSRQAASDAVAEENLFEYDLLIYVANWPDRRIHAWKTLLQARAIENQCYTVGVNRVGDDANGIHYTGCSMVIDPLGEVLYQQQDDEDIKTLALDKNHLDNIRQKFPFWKDADRFHLLK